MRTEGEAPCCWGSIQIQIPFLGVSVGPVGQVFDFRPDLLDSPLWQESLYEQYAKKWGITKEEVRRKYLEQVPLGRGCEYEDVANAVVFLASKRASYMTGQAINVTGGQEMR